MPSDPVISAHELTKTYRLFAHPGDRVRQFLSGGLRRYHREFTALQGVSFSIGRGESVGIIGRNGSGKSTLLQLICGILAPTAGTVRTQGRVAALLELGAGFNPEFTGRENVYFQGMLQGYSEKEIDQRFDQITDFADIGEFIDQPVRIYSSGMFVRLAFAVAVFAEPDLLLIDEALAVGDAAFQEKCFRRIDQIRAQGGTVLLVTHVAEQVAHHCDRALLLEQGRLVADGPTASTLSRYSELLNQTSQVLPSGADGPRPLISAAGDPVAQHPGYNRAETRWGDRLATIDAITLRQQGVDNPSAVAAGTELEVVLRTTFHADIDQPVYGISIKADTGVIVFASNSRLLAPQRTERGASRGDVATVVFRLRPVLAPGAYSLSVGVTSADGNALRSHDRRYDCIALDVVYPRTASGDIDLQARFELLDLQRG